MSAPPSDIDTSSTITMNEHNNPKVNIEFTNLYCIKNKKIKKGNGMYYHSHSIFIVAIKRICVLNLIIRKATFSS